MKTTLFGIAAMVIYYGYMAVQALQSVMHVITIS